jgi:hypothetical protein
MQPFYAIQKWNYLAAGVASFLTALVNLPFFIVLGLLALGVAFFSTVGDAVAVGTAGAATSAAKTTAEKDNATIAATNVEITFFMCKTSNKSANLSFYIQHTLCQVL